LMTLLLEKLKRYPVFLYNFFYYNNSKLKYTKKLNYE